MKMNSLGWFRGPICEDFQVTENWERTWYMDVYGAPCVPWFFSGFPHAMLTLQIEMLEGTVLAA